MVRTCPTCGVHFCPTARAQRYCMVRCRPSMAASYVQRMNAKRRSGPAKVRGRKPDQDKRTVVTAMRAAGFTHQQIALALGVTRQAVGKLLSKSAPQASKPDVPPPPLAG